MSRYIFLILLIHSVFSDDCVKYNFENDFEDLFVRHKFPCAYEGITYYEPWNYTSYSDTTVSPPNDKSKKFISAATYGFISCVSSFPFTMAPGGTVEVNVYIGTKSQMEHVIVEVHEVGDMYYSHLAGHVDLSDVEPGWHVVRVEDLVGEDEDKPFEGYVTFWGGSDIGSIVIVDSFRYFPPLY